MKIKLGLIVCLLVSGVLHAQKPVTVECSVGEGVGTTIQLFGVDKGEKKVLASASYNQNGYYGFSFIPKYEGFYVVGDGRLYEYPLYLKAGDAVSLFMDKDTVYLTGKHNTAENKVLYECVKNRHISCGYVIVRMKIFSRTLKPYLQRQNRFARVLKRKILVSTN